MQTKLKRGPKLKPATEKKVAVIFWVKQKFYNEAKKDADVLERKFYTKESQPVFSDPRVVSC